MDEPRTDEPRTDEPRTDEPRKDEPRPDGGRSARMRRDAGMGVPEMTEPGTGDRPEADEEKTARGSTPGHSPPPGPERG